MKEPRLRNVEKYQPPYPLNTFPKDFALHLGRELAYHIASRDSRLEGQDWEEIFSRLINAEWKPSNVGLDDIVLQQCAWGAKTVKNHRPSTAQSVRLISGRNSLAFSYDVKNIHEYNLDELGAMILNIWNERVSAIKKDYKHLRTVVLIKSDDLLEVAAFEFDTIRFDAEQFSWHWNARNNLEGFEERGEHKFTWQPHGAQFTIVEQVPKNRLAMRIQQPPSIDRDSYLESINFGESWIELL